MAHQLFVRHGDKPLITPDDLPFEANAVLNPGVAEMNGEVLLLQRIEDATGVSHIHVARSANGVDRWRVEERPLLEADLPEYPFEEWGCEDPRVTRIGPKMWIIAYTAVFPELFGGMWILLHRPVTGGQEHIWHACSPEMAHWSLPGVSLPQQGGPWWDSLRVGVGAPPLRTDQGSLLIYQG